MADVTAIAVDLVKAFDARDWDAGYRHASRAFVKTITPFVLTETYNRVRLAAGSLVEVVRTKELRHLLAPVRVVFVVCKYQRCMVTAEVGFEEDKVSGFSLLTPDL